MSWPKNRPQSAGRRRKPNNLQAECGVRRSFPIDRRGGFAGPPRRTSSHAVEAKMDATAA